MPHHAGNSGTPWTALDDNDIRWQVDHARTVAEIADLICRTPAEVEQRIRELGLEVPDSGNVVRLRR